ncbi:uncharacterized protein LOC101204960 [Anopheles sinensis]|uniref:Uncharacterized protein LOC101204960 n=1 Tax=Anopheles sinensis TaxID=74873 RepID=A0A084WP54_ANOSI|nr:uncharacterized protein LOC101204960 [Anopheles sinensis]
MPGIPFLYGSAVRWHRYYLLLLAVIVGNSGTYQTGRANEELVRKTSTLVGEWQATNRIKREGNAKKLKQATGSGLGWNVIGKLSA